MHTCMCTNALIKVSISVRLPKRPGQCYGDEGVGVSRSEGVEKTGHYCPFFLDLSLDFSTDQTDQGGILEVNVTQGHHKPFSLKPHFSLLPPGTYPLLLFHCFSAQFIYSSWLSIHTIRFREINMNLKMNFLIQCLV